MFEPIDPETALQLVHDWGFVAHPALAGGDGQSWLSLALRPQPTLKHFDPESVQYWVSAGGRGRQRELTVHSRLPIHEPFSWGTIHAVDRLGIGNEWVTFGGELFAADVDGTVVCLFRSDAPILRRGGHSQGWDHGAANLAAFFGRIKVAVDYEAGFEALLCCATPRTLYAAFVADLAERYRMPSLLPELYPALAQLVRAEEARLRSAEPQVWEAGTAIAGAVGLATGEAQPVA